MKRKFFKVSALLVIVFTTMTVSCRKETQQLQTRSTVQTPQGTVTYQETHAKLLQLGKDYAQKDKKNGVHYVLAPDAWGTVLHDACGALGGAWLGPFGAFCGATTASVCHAFGEGSYKNSNPNTSSDNEDNPYNYYGILHNESSTWVLGNIDSYIDPLTESLDVPTIISDLRTYANTNHATKLSMASATSNSNVNDLIDIMLGLPLTATHNDILDELENESYISSDINALMDDYFDTFITTSTAIEYSLAAEKIIFDSTELTSTEKESLLIAMAVARNSYVLWDQE